MRMHFDTAAEHLQISNSIRITIQDENQRIKPDFPFRLLGYRALFHLGKAFPQVRNSSLLTFAHLLGNLTIFAFTLPLPAVAQHLRNQDTLLTIFCFREAHRSVRGL